MGDGRRVGRVERSLRELISSYLVTRYRDILPGLVSVPFVRASADLRNAKVYVSVFSAGADEEANSEDLVNECLEILNQDRHQIQEYVGRELKMKFCPKLRFFSDDVQKTVLSVEKKLHDLQKERESTEESKEN